MEEAIKKSRFDKTLGHDKVTNVMIKALPTPEVEQLHRGTQVVIFMIKQKAKNSKMKKSSSQVQL